MCYRPAAANLNKCWKCGKINKPIATVCVDCGAKIEPGKAPCPQCETMKDPMAVCPSCGFVPEVDCPKCGTKNPVTSTQCAKCGYNPAPQMPPTPGRPGGSIPPKAPPAPPKAPPPVKKPGE